MSRHGTRSFVASVSARLGSACGLQPFHWRAGLDGARRVAASQSGIQSYSPKSSSAACNAIMVTHSTVDWDVSTIRDRGVRTRALVFRHSDDSTSRSEPSKIADPALTEIPASFDHKTSSMDIPPVAERARCASVISA